jgi:hypothetical protein
MRYLAGVDPRADGRMRRGGRRKLGKSTMVMRTRAYSESEIAEALAEGRPNRQTRMAAKSMGLTLLSDRLSRRSAGVF